VRPAQHPDGILIVADELGGRVYEFGPFRLSAASGLTRAGSYLPLPPKELSVLRLLVKRAGQIVTKDELASGAWREGVPSDDSIARSVHLLRVALGPFGTDQIRTIYGKGYLFAAPVAVSRSQHPVERAAMHGHGHNPAAIALFHAGLLAMRGSADDLTRALTMLTEASRLDAGYAAVHGAIAELWIARAIRGFAATAEVSAAITQTSAAALAIEPGQPSALAAQAWHLGVVERNHQASLQSFAGALAADPNYANGLYYRSWVHRTFGEHDLAIADLNAASGAAGDEGAYKPALAYELFCARQVNEALEQTRRPPISLQGLVALNSFRAIIAAWLGLHEEAVDAGRAAVTVSQRDGTVMCSLAYALARAGDREGAQGLLDELLQSPGKPVIASTLPAAFLALGNEDAALAWLDLADTKRCPWLGSALRDPRLDPLADDRRVVALKRKFFI
jgi:DNA-binding winged helix-turn-helix (wHTH) protein